MSSDFFAGLIVGAIGMLIVFSVVLPDRISTWIGARRNLPLWMLPIAFLAFVIGVVWFLWGLWTPLIQALSVTEFTPTIWVLLFGGLITLLICSVVLWLRGRPTAPVTPAPPAGP